VWTLWCGDDEPVAGLLQQSAAMVVAAAAAADPAGRDPRTYGSGPGWQKKLKSLKLMLVLPYLF
jgi:hypothetical protein